MITNREFVARVVNNLKATTKDDHISRRFVLSIGQIKAKFFMAQKLDEMTLFREEEIISHIDCFAMERIDAVHCNMLEFKGCNSLMRSVNKLPKGIFGKNGSGIISVMSMDRTKRLHFITEREFAGLKNLRYLYDDKNYYSIRGENLLLPNSEWEAVAISMITPHKWEVDQLSSCCPAEQKCKSFWDYEFVCPERFLDLVHRDTLQEVASIYRTSVIDENPNLDENQKTQTQQ